MRGRERLFATAAIWISFAVIMNNLLDRFTRLNADFTGLWPSFSPPSGENSWETFQQMMGEAQRVSSQLLSEVTTSMSRQLSDNMGVLVLLSLAVIFAAMMSTIFVWRNAHLEASEPARAVKASGKAKRGAANNRVELVMNNLDDNELAELRSRLEAESEPVSFEELLMRREAEQRLRH